MKWGKLIFSVLLVGAYLYFDRAFQPIITQNMALMQMQNNEANFVTWQSYKNLLNIAPLVVGSILVLTWFDDAKKWVEKFFNN